jgi:drug/metabolite transporter (DMT)-like permease
MPPTAFLLIFISALAHVFWNLLGKRSQPSAAYFLVTTLSAVIIFFPVLVVFRTVILKIPSLVWVLLILTGISQAFYYTALAGSYRSGDLSLAYPLVRAIPVILVPIVRLSIGRGQELTSIALGGMGMVVLGCFLVPLQKFNFSSFKKMQNTAVFMAILAALGTTGYLLADDTALHVLKITPSFVNLSPMIPILVYSELETLTTAFFLAIYVMINKRELTEWKWVKTNTWKTASFSGLIMTSGYILVLTAMVLARDISYVTAFRQISIPIGALFGILIFKERAYLPKLVGVFIIFFGLILVGLG